MRICARDNSDLLCLFAVQVCLLQLCLFVCLCCWYPYCSTQTQHPNQWQLKQKLTVIFPFHLAINFSWKYTVHTVTWHDLALVKGQPLSVLKNEWEYNSTSHFNSCNGKCGIKNNSDDRLIVCLISAHNLKGNLCNLYEKCFSDFPTKWLSQV